MQNTALVLVRKLPGFPKEHPDLSPSYEFDVGLDLMANIWEPKIIKSGDFIDMPTGLALKISDDYWGMIRARGSTFYKRRLFVHGASIDPGFVGELFIGVWNPGPLPRQIHPGERIAQLVIVPRVQVTIEYVSELPKTERGEKGFGSTGGLNVTDPLADEEKETGGEEGGREL